MRLTTITAEAITAAPSHLAARYYALFHLLPRMLVTEASLRRAKAAAPRPYWNQGKKKQQQRHCLRLFSNDNPTALRYLRPLISSPIPPGPPWALMTLM